MCQGSGTATIDILMFAGDAKDGSRRRGIAVKWGAN